MTSLVRKGLTGSLVQVCCEFVTGQTMDQFYRARQSKSASWQPPVLEALELWSAQIFTALVFLHSRLACVSAVSLAVRVCVCVCVCKRV